jgi:hypothetical protein
MTQETVIARFSATFSTRIGESFSRDAGDEPAYTGHKREILDDDATWYGDVYCHACDWAGHASELEHLPGNRQATR